MSDVSQVAPPAKSQAAPYWFPDTRTFIVAWMMISTFIVVVLCWWKPPSPDNQLLNTLIGIYCTGGFATAIGWWMHSSKGSEDKSDTIAAQLPKGP